MQAEAPNTFRAVHTMIAFRATAAEFHHRLHVYQDQGFFHEKLVDEVEYAMETRERELEQYVFLDSAQVMLGLITCNKFNADHPIVGTFEQDKVATNRGSLATNKNVGIEDGADHVSALPKADPDDEVHS